MGPPCRIFSSISRPPYTRWDAPSLRGLSPRETGRIRYSPSCSLPDTLPRLAKAPTLFSAPCPSGRAQRSRWPVDPAGAHAQRRRRRVHQVPYDKGAILKLRRRVSCCRSAPPPPSGAAVRTLRRDCPSASPQTCLRVHPASSSCHVSDGPAPLPACCALEIFRGGCRNIARLPPPKMAFRSSSRVRLRAGRKAADMLRRAFLKSSVSRSCSRCSLSQMLRCFAGRFCHSAAIVSRFFFKSPTVISPPQNAPRPLFFNGSEQMFYILTHLNRPGLTPL